jgi:hypothetical protein
MGLDECLVRLSIGLENPDDLKRDLASSLNTIDPQAKTSHVPIETWDAKVFEMEHD